MFNFLKQVSNYVKGVLNPHGVPADAHRTGMLPSEILEKAGADGNNAN